MLDWVLGTEKTKAERKQNGNETICFEVDKLSLTYALKKESSGSAEVNFESFEIKAEMGKM